MQFFCVEKYNSQTFYSVYHGKDVLSREQTIGQKEFIEISDERAKEPLLELIRAWKIGNLRLSGADVIAAEEKKASILQRMGDIVLKSPSEEVRNAARKEYKKLAGYDFKGE